MKAALVLSLFPTPSIIPAPIAITFFNAPPISTPITSLDLYTFKFVFSNNAADNSSDMLLLDERVTAVGSSLATSLGKLGPESVTYFLLSILADSENI